MVIEWGVGLVLGIVLGFLCLPCHSFGVACLVRHLALASLRIVFIFVCFVFLSPLQDVLHFGAKFACYIPGAEALPRLGWEFLPLWPLPQQGGGGSSHHLLGMSVGQEWPRLCSRPYMPTMCSLGCGPVGTIPLEEDLC